MPAFMGEDPPNLPRVLPPPTDPCLQSPVQAEEVPYPVQGQDCSLPLLIRSGRCLGLHAWNTGAPPQNLDKASFGPHAPSRT